MQALEELARRPGTVHEGIVARQKLTEFRKKEIKTEPDPTTWQIQTVWKCPCGSLVRVGEKCPKHEAHERIRTEIRAKFKKGARVYYNYWAYEPNCTATVIGHMKQPDDKNWAWIRLKFDHLKSGYRSVPIHSDKGWHLSHEPLSLLDAYWLIKH